ncbi:MAG TPA: hypothetical protein VFG07_08065 [Thermoplasmata archaeon]|nr:hypothetical protein [Thermoplasmata archaeon]
MAASPRRLRNVPLLTASVSSALLVVLLVVAWTTPAFTASSSSVLRAPPSAPPDRGTGALPTMVIVPAGSTYQLPAGAFQSVVFQLSMAASVNGSFSASGLVTSTILTAAGFESFETTGLPPGSLWLTGPSSGGSVGIALPAGTYYLVFADLGSAHSTFVSVASGIAATFPPPPP